MREVKVMKVKTSKKKPQLLKLRVVPCKASNVGKHSSFLFAVYNTLPRDILHFILLIWDDKCILTYITCVH